MLQPITARAHLKGKALLQDTFQLQAVPKDQDNTLGRPIPLMRWEILLLQERRTAKSGQVMSVINIPTQLLQVREENLCTHLSLIRIIRWEAHTSRSTWGFLTLEKVTQHLIRAFHPPTAKRTRRRAPRRRAPVIARSQDVSNYTANVSLRNAFVRVATAVTAGTPLKTRKNGTKPLKIPELKTRQHSLTDSVWKILKALKRYRKYTIWVVNARNLPA